MNTSNCVINNVMHGCAELLKKYSNCNIICCGDFNGRTADFQVNDTSKFVPSLEDLLDHSDMYLGSRKLHDSELNDFGKRLLEPCACFGLCLLSGFINRDLEGNFTFVSDYGNSVVYYFPVFSCLFSAFQRLVVEGGKGGI